MKMLLSSIYGINIIKPHDTQIRTFRIGRRFAFVFEAWLFDPMMMAHNEPQIMGGPGIRYFRKINRVTAKNGAGAKTWDFQLLHLPGSNGGDFIPMFGASQKF